MSYSVNWIAKVVSIPTADLTLVSGFRYSLNMADFLAEIRRLEWEFLEGLWAPSILIHTNTRNDFAGANYAPFDDMINDYTVQFTGVANRVDLLGSNNDIVDILIATGVSVVPSNSAGLQIVDSGGEGGGNTEAEFHDYMDSFAGKDEYKAAGISSETVKELIAATEEKEEEEKTISDLEELKKTWRL